MHLSYYKGSLGPIDAELLFPFIKEYILPETWQCTDGLVGYTSYVEQHPEQGHKLYQVSHKNKEYGRLEKHHDSEGNFIGNVSLIISRLTPSPTYPQNLEK